jgi:hypothetical protein
MSDRKFDKQPDHSTDKGFTGSGSRMDSRPPVPTEDFTDPFDPEPDEGTRDGDQ